MKPEFDEHLFINKATQNLFSSMRIEEALHNTIAYLKNYIPVDILNAGVGDNSQQTVRYLAVANENSGVLVDETVRLSAGAVKDRKRYKFGKAVIDNSIESSRGVQEALLHFISAGIDIYQDERVNEFSTMTLTIGLGKPVFAYYNLLAFGSNRYTDLHRKRLKLLMQPLTGAILNLIHHRDIQSQNEKLKKVNEDLRIRLGHMPATQIIGAKKGLKYPLEKSRQVAATDSPVLLTGETGTGKELFAHAIHQMSKRASQPMVCINCGALPESIVESELFGHEKGAFTGASGLKRGYFEQADGGTLFLDEVAELPVSVQVKLLRVLQEKAFYRVGGQRLISVNVRVITATHRDLNGMVSSGGFRKDLWFRLNVFPIHLPPLRERREDIPEMASHIAILKAREMNLAFSPQFAKGAMEELTNYSWPGNIRELQNIIEHRLIISGSSPLSFPDLNHYKTGHLEDNENRNDLESFRTIHEMTADYIRKALHLTRGRIYGKGGAAQLLGLHPSTLQGKMRKYKIEK